MKKIILTIAKIALFAFVGAYVALPEVIDSKYGGLVVLAFLGLVILIGIDMKKVVEEKLGK